MRFYYFLQLQMHFEVIRNVLLRNGGKLIFRRFDPTGGTRYGFEIVDYEQDDLTSIYMEGGYREMYVSLKKVPRQFDDWDFPDRAQKELIIIEGGHEQDGVIALSEMLLQDRQSRAKSLFGKLQRAFKKRCTQKGLHANPNGHFYARVYYDPELIGKYRLQEGLEYDGYVFEPQSR